MRSIDVLEHICALSSSEDYFSNFINSAMYSRAADSDHCSGPCNSHLYTHRLFVKTTPESQASHSLTITPHPLPTAYSSSPCSVFGEKTPITGWRRLLCFTINTQLLLHMMVMMMKRKRKNEEKKTTVQGQGTTGKERWSVFFNSFKIFNHQCLKYRNKSFH